jgi:hypothetical protein
MKQTKGNITKHIFLKQKKIKKKKQNREQTKEKK